MTDVPSRWSAGTEAVVAKLQELTLPSTDPSMPAVRARYEAELTWWNEGGPDVPTETREVPTRHGPVRVVVHRPRPDPAPAIVYLHGGGMIVGSPESHHRLTRTLAHHTGATVASVAYTLAPEAQHPRPIEECVDVVQALRADAEDWGVRADDLSLAGDSAGATLSLATWLWLRDELGAHEVTRSRLLPCGASGLPDSVSRRTLGGWWDGMDADAMADWQRTYLGDADPRGPYVDLLARDLVGVPPSHVLATDLDPLLDDSRALAALLGDGGHELRVREGLLHTFLQHGRMLDEAEDALQDMARFFLGCAP